MADLRPEYIDVLEAMSESESTTPEQLAEKSDSIHTVILALSVLYYDGLVDIRTYRRTARGTEMLAKLRSDQTPEIDLAAMPAVMASLEQPAAASLA